MKASDPLLGGTDIFCSRVLPDKGFLPVLKRNFTKFTFSPLAEDGATSGSENQAYYSTEPIDNSAEYPFKIGVDMPENEQPASAFLRLCRDLSIEFSMRCFCEYHDPADPKNPYLACLFDNGAGFIVDDSDWDEERRLKVLRPFTL